MTLAGVSWEELSFSAKWDKMRIAFDNELKAYFSFSGANKIQEITKDLKVKVSEVNAFSLNGSMGMEIDIKPQYTIQGSIPLLQTPDGEKSTIMPGILRRLTLYIIPPFEIPLWVEDIVDIRANLSLSASASASFSYGCKIDGRVKMDISYIKDNGWKMNGSAPFEGEAYPFEMEVDKTYSTDIKLTIYPHIQTLFYSTVGFYHDIKPYVMNSFAASTLSKIDDRIPFYHTGWTDKLTAGVEYQSGVELNFLGLKSLAEKPIMPTIDVSTPFMKMPEILSINSPSNDIDEIPVNTPTEIKFHVDGTAFGKRLSFPTPLTTVVFYPSGNSTTNVVSALTDSNGDVSVQWTPTSTEDKLTAIIYDGNYKPISEVVYATNNFAINRKHR